MYSEVYKFLNLYSCPLIPYWYSCSSNLSKIIMITFDWHDKTSADIMVLAIWFNIHIFNIHIFNIIKKTIFSFQIPEGGLVWFGLVCYKTADPCIAHCFELHANMYIEKNENNCPICQWYSRVVHELCLYIRWVELWYEKLCQNLGFRFSAGNKNHLVKSYSQKLPSKLSFQIVTHLCNS